MDNFFSKAYADTLYVGASYVDDEIAVALQTLNASNLTSGTVPDARLSANVPRLNTVQTYSLSQTFSAMAIFNGGFDLGSSGVMRRTSFFVWRNTAVGKHSFRNWVETAGVTLDYSVNGVLNIRNMADTGSGDLIVGNFTLFPSASRTPSSNGELVVEATSNTQLTFKFRGSDGTVRTGAITLS